MRLDAGDYYILDTTPTNWSSDCFVAVRKSAVKIVEEPRYHIGQRFNIDGNRYLLAQVSNMQVVLVELSSGSNYSIPIIVGNYYKITQVELNTISNGKAKLITI